MNAVMATARCHPVDVSAHRLIALDDTTSWLAALDGIAHGFAHTHAHAAALSHSLTSAPVLYSGRTGGGRIVCPFVERDDGVRDVYTPFGFGGFCGRPGEGDFLADWRGFARARGYVSAYIALHPVFAPACFTAAPEARASHKLYVVDLRDGADAVFANCARSVRQKLRTFERQPPRLVTDVQRLVDALPRLYAHTRERVGAGASYGFSDATLAGWLRAPNTLAYGVASGADICAISVFGFTRYGADYLLNAATPNGREYAAGLIGCALRALSKRGVPHLNLGGGVCNDDGLARFKARFGGAGIALTALELVCDETRFEALGGAVATKAAGPRFFPAYRAPLRAQTVE